MIDHSVNQTVMLYIYPSWWVH